MASSDPDVKQCETHWIGELHHSSAVAPVTILVGLDSLGHS
jgi:hypothetical protein